MCGIFAVHGLEKPTVFRPRAVALSKKLRHRGPDWSGCYVGKDAILTHERLAIVGVGQCQQLTRRYRKLSTLIQTLERNRSSTKITL
jgi:asparagine synthetase B (glutamine-hydrolysing)